MAGAMRCDGRVCVSCTIRSPRSVSTTSMPSASRCGFRSISSPAIDLTLVTTMRPPSERELPAFQQIWAMMSRASAASLAKCTFPPTASNRCLNCSASSGSLWRLAWRLAFKSARPLAKSRLSKALSRFERSPVMAWSRAFWRSGPPSALLTRREKWSRDSGTARLNLYGRGCFQRFDNTLASRHRRQAYGPDAHDGICLVLRPARARQVSTGIDHHVRMRESRRARQLRVAGGHFDRMARAVEGAGEGRRHQAVLPRQRRHRFEGPPCACQMRGSGIAGQNVELDERHRRDRVLSQRLDRFGQAAECAGGGMVEVAAAARIAITLLEGRGKIQRRRHPLVAKPSLVGAKRRPQAPDLVGQLRADSLRMAHTFTASISALEEALEQFFRLFAKRRPVKAPGCFEVGDGEGRVPRRVDAPVDIRRGRLRALLAVHGVVVLVRVLAAGIEP